MRKFRLKSKILFAGLVVCLCSFLSVLIARGVILSASEGRIHSELSTLPNFDTALVLGCSQYLSDGRQNLFFKYRIQKAQELYAFGTVQSIIVSGDNHTKGYDEPTDMKEALVELGVPEDRIYCDYAGFSTLDSVVRAKEIFGQQELIVVSQEFHNKRAIFIGRNNDMEIHGLNAQDVILRHALKTKVREELARVKTVLDVWILRRKPKFLGEPIEMKVTITQ